MRYTPRLLFMKCGSEYPREPMNSSSIKNWLIAIGTLLPIPFEKHGSKLFHGPNRISITDLILREILQIENGSDAYSIGGF